MEDLDRIPKKSNIRVKEQDGKYVIFNLETSGFHMIEKDAMDVINKIASVETNSSDKPLTDVVIQNIELLTFEG